jgi:hypothetical protein
MKNWDSSIIDNENLCKILAKGTCNMVRTSYIRWDDNNASFVLDITLSDKSLSISFKSLFALQPLVPKCCVRACLSLVFFWKSITTNHFHQYISYIVAVSFIGGENHYAEYDWRHRCEFNMKNWDSSIIDNENLCKILAKGTCRTCRTHNRNYSAILATLQITSYVHSRNSS